MSMDIQIKSLQNSLSAAASNMAAWRRQAEAEEKMNMDRKVAEAEEEWRSLQEELRAAWAEDERGRMEELVVGLEGPREPYAFKSSAAINKNENDPSDAFERGVSSFEAGEIADAISAFEEVLNLDQSNAKAWRYLGRCHQEVDSDADAITCFEHAVQVDPYDLDSLLNLGVSYVNEMDQARALRSIRGWLAGNPAYSHLSGPSELHESANPELQLESLLSSALAVNPSDPTVLEALGVLYNSTRSFDQAETCFDKAIAIRPTYELWNKLGATRANAGKSDQVRVVVGVGVNHSKQNILT